MPALLIRARGREGGHPHMPSVYMGAQPAVTRNIVGHPILLRAFGEGVRSHLEVCCAKRSRSTAEQVGRVGRRGTIPVTATTVMLLWPWLIPARGQTPPPAW